MRRNRTRSLLLFAMIPLLATLTPFASTTLYFSFARFEITPASYAVFQSSSIGLSFVDVVVLRPDPIVFATVGVDPTQPADGARYNDLSDYDGGSEMFLMVIPEPGSFALLALGTALLALRRRRS